MEVEWMNSSADKQVSKHRVLGADNSMKLRVENVHGRSRRGPRAHGGGEHAGI